MRVLHFPFFGENPYQRLLIAALNEQGVEAGSVNKRTGNKVFRRAFILLDVVFRYRKTEILHLHWVEPWIGTTESKGRRKHKLRRALQFVGELAVLRLAGVKIVWTVHNLIGHESHKVGRELFFRRIIAFLSHSIIVHCPKAQEEIAHAYKIRRTSKIAVIPLGEYGCYQNTITQEQAKNRLGVAVDKKVFLFMGGIRPHKGVLELVDAFKRLNVPDALLLIVGRCWSEDLSGRITRACQDDKRIQLVFEFVPDEDIQLYMNTADVTVFPFRKVFTSSSIMLSMSFGKPVIAPSLGCIPYLLDGTNNIVYDPNSHNALLDALQQALESDLPQIGQENFRHMERFGWDMIAQQTRGVYAQCLPLAR